MALARGLLPDMSGSWVLNQTSRLLTTGLISAWLISVRLSGTKPRAAFSTVNRRAKLTPDRRPKLPPYCGVEIRA
jgi:hypothetical protein